MPDVRVDRTRTRVFAAVRGLLADSADDLTISRIADAAGIARKTVYAHWSGVPAILADLLLSVHETPPPPATEDLATAAHRFLRDVRDGLADPALGTAMALLIAAAPSDPAAASALRRTTARRAEHLAAIVGARDADRLLAELVGPIFFARFVALAPVSDAFIDELVARVLQKGWVA